MPFFVIPDRLYVKKAHLMHIRMDHREKLSGLMFLIREKGVPLTMTHLERGDYIINDAVTVERKTARDFIISLVDGRLFRQLAGMKRHCLRPVLLIEGNPFRAGTHMHPAAIRGALISTQVIWQIPVIFSRSKEDTRDLLIMIGKQEEPRPTITPLRSGYRPKKLRSRQLNILQSLPRVGPLLALRLMEHFGSVVGVLTAPTGALTQVPGIGKRTAAAIRTVLNARFQRNSP